MAVLHELVERGRHRAAQHALRRRRTPRRRLREHCGRSTLTSSTATPAASSTGPRGDFPATIRPVPRWPVPTGSTAGSTTTAGPRGPQSRSATPGNGFLSAIAMIQALYHRDRTGEGQFVDTVDHVRPASPTRRSRGTRPRVSSTRGDRRSMHATRMVAVVPLLRHGRWMALPCGGRRGAPPSVREMLRASAQSATPPSTLRGSDGRSDRDRLGGTLDRVGVPAEVSDPDFVLCLFDDPEMIAKGWVT